MTGPQFPALFGSQWVCVFAGDLAHFLQCEPVVVGAHHRSRVAAQQLHSGSLHHRAFASVRKVSRFQTHDKGTISRFQVVLPF